MRRFVIRKNTLPYVHQWAVIDTKTSKKISEHKTKETAIKARNHYEQRANMGIFDEKLSVEEYQNKTAEDILTKRMQDVTDDIEQKRIPQFPNQRSVELDW